MCVFLACFFVYLCLLFLCCLFYARRELCAQTSSLPCAGWCVYLVPKAPKLAQESEIADNYTTWVSRSCARRARRKRQTVDRGQLRCKGEVFSADPNIPLRTMHLRPCTRMIYPHDRNTYTLNPLVPTYSPSTPSEHASASACAPLRDDPDQVKEIRQR